LQQVNTRLKDKLNGTLNLLDQLQTQCDIHKDVNVLFRKFYARNIISQMNQDEYDEYLEKGLRDFNKALNNRSNFISRELEALERIADKTSSVPEHLRVIMLPGLEKAVEDELKLHALNEATLKQITRAKV
jgi:hypothetical protein